jgi:MYXO-CTERM domain-containing protein
VGDAPLTYDVRLYADAGLTVLVGEQLGVPGTDDGVVVFAPALNEGASSWWIARASDAWASGPWSAPESFVVDALQEPPGIPVLIEPRNGTTVGVSDPVLRWSAVTDPDGDEVIYQVYWNDGVFDYVEETTDTRLRISPGLADGTSVPWAVLATDASGSGQVASETWIFVVDTSNQPPSSPEVLSPTPGGVLTSTPATVEIRDGVDPEGRATTQRFELDTTPTFDGPDLQSAELPGEGDGTTTWSPAPLREDTLYHLRVLADDGASSSPWTQTTFFVNTQNDPPTSPFPVLPLDGETWFEGVALVVANATDPEGFELRYEFVVYDDSGTIKAQSTSVPSGVDRTAWAPSGLPPGVFTWTARATDPLGAQGPWSESWSFIVAGPGPGPNSRTVPAPTDVDPADVLTGCGCASADPARWGGLAALGWLVLLRRRR